MNYPVKAWSYIVTTAATELAVPLAEVKTWLKLTGSTQDAEITALIKGATASAEKFMKRDLINKKYQTFRDQFSDFERYYGNYSALIPGGSGYYSCQQSIELRRSRLQSVDLFQYLTSDVWTDVPVDDYYSTEEVDFSSIFLADGKSWPSEIDNRKEAIKIEFTAGYGPDSDSIPFDIKTAIKMHVANAFWNRGDCSDATFIPNGSYGTYNQYRIIDIGV